MLNEILNLEGVAVLSKEQQKSVNGGWYLKNVVCTGKPYNNTSGAPGGDQATAWECTGSRQKTFLGFDWGTAKPDTENVYACTEEMCK